MIRRLRSHRSGAVGDQPAAPPPPLSAGAHDLWLTGFWGDRLDELDRACAGAGSEMLAGFADLPPAVWAMLICQQQTAYPHIAALLPAMPTAETQELWNGASGLALAAQSCAFYERLLELNARHGLRPLAESRVLDFGCGWGRLTRLLARDVAPGRLCGCDPSGPILEVARADRVPAVLAQSEFVPDRVPFEEPFELAFAFSVFTHLSESAHLASLRALHGALAPDGLLVLTIRPPEYLRTSPRMRPLLEGLAPARLQAPLYLFVAHEQLPLVFDAPEVEVTYGETVLNLPYVRERWAQWFELLEVTLSLADPQQIVLALRRRTG